MDLYINKLLEESDNLNISLYDGKMGLLLYLCLKNHCPTEVEYGLLQDISEKINTISDLSFSQGLLGICWGLSNINIDLPDTINNFLKDFDDYVYKSIVNYQQIDFSLERGAIGKALYLYQRLKSSKDYSYYQDIALRECLVLLIIELNKHLKRLFKRGLDVLINPHEEQNILYAINLLYDIKELGMNDILTDEILYTTKMFIIDYISNNINCSMKYSKLLYCIGTISCDNDLLKLCHNDKDIYLNKKELNHILAKLLYNSNLSCWYMFKR